MATVGKSTTRFHGEFVVPCGWMSITIDDGWGIKDG